MCRYLEPNFIYPQVAWIIDRLCAMSLAQKIANGSFAQKSANTFSTTTEHLVKKWAFRSKKIIER
jgi:hypothetical protein